MSDFNRRLGSMIVLTTLVVVPVVSMLDDPKFSWILTKEVNRFLALSAFLSLVCTFWTFFLDSNRPKVTFGLLLKIVWCMGLLATFFVFLNHLDVALQLAIEFWGDWGGKSAIIIFCVTWLYTVFNFFYCRRAITSAIGSGTNFSGVHFGSINVATMTFDNINPMVNTDRNVPQTRETARMTLVTSVIVIVVLCLGFKGYIPDLLGKFYVFLVIWSSWICIFVIGYLMLMRGLKHSGWMEMFKVDFSEIAWGNLWDYTMMTSIIAFGITLFRYVLPTPFGLQEYFCFCSFLLCFVVIMIHAFRFLMDDE